MDYLDRKPRILTAVFWRMSWLFLFLVIYIYMGSLMSPFADLWFSVGFFKAVWLCKHLSHSCHCQDSGTEEGTRERSSGYFSIASLWSFEWGSDFLCFDMLFKYTRRIEFLHLLGAQPLISIKFGGDGRCPKDKFLQFFVKVDNWPKLLLNISFPSLFYTLF